MKTKIRIMALSVLFMISLSILLMCDKEVVEV